MKKNQFKIYANYGVLGSEKMTVYTDSTPHANADVSDEMVVELPKNDSFELYENYMGDLMVETAWGDRYMINDVLYSLNDKPVFKALENGNEMHMVYLEEVKEVEETKDIYFIQNEKNDLKNGGYDHNSEETKEKVIVIMKDDHTQRDAVRLLKSGTTVYKKENFERFFDDYMKDWDCGEEQKKEYKKMLETNEPITNWGVVEYKGKTYLINYFY